MASTEQTSQESKSYEGSCHCQAVKYTVTTTPPIEEQKLVSCNCSICAERCPLVFFATSGDLKITGGDSLSDPYKFNKKTISYRFCKNCGSHLFGHTEDKTQYGINARTLHDIDVKTLKTQHLDGASA